MGIFRIVQQPARGLGERRQCAPPEAEISVMSGAQRHSRFALRGEHNVETCRKAVAGTCCDWEANSYRFAQNKGDRLPALAADFVDHRLRMEFSERTCLGSLSSLRSAQAE